MGWKGSPGPALGTLLLSASLQSSCQHRNESKLARSQAAFKTTTRTDESRRLLSMAELCPHRVLDPNPRCD